MQENGVLYHERIKHWTICCLNNTNAERPLWSKQEFNVFGLNGDWKRNKINECCLHAMVCCWWFRTLSCGNRNPNSNPGFSPFYLFLFVDPIFQRQRNLHNTVFHRKYIILFTWKSISLYTRNSNNKEMANGYIITWCVVYQIVSGT